MFSSKPSNRRRRSKKASDRSWIDDSASSKAKPKAARKAKSSTPRDQAHKLHAQIGAIESFLDMHHQAEVQRMQMKRENILPPPDRSNHRQARKTVTLAARRREMAERNRTSFKFLVMFCTACAICWWLIFAGV
ncbi:MAG: hypothetical protein P1U68_06295 [Verrucomicrobiales bacterium]|nr:hypothetical protein [Verrucomicrobiales bacterium]